MTTIRNYFAASFLCGVSLLTVNAKEPAKQTAENHATNMVQRLDADVNLSEQQSSQLKTLALNLEAQIEATAKITDISERIRQRKAMYENYNAAVNTLLTEEQIALRAEKEKQRRQQREEEIREILNQRERR